MAVAALIFRGECCIGGCEGVVSGSICGRSHGYRGQGGGMRLLLFFEYRCICLSPRDAIIRVDFCCRSAGDCADIMELAINKKLK